MPKDREVPQGFTLVPFPTKAGNYGWNQEVLQADSLEAWLAAWEAEGKNAAEVARDIINAAQKQGATQGPKEEVRKALADVPDGVDPGSVEAVQKAVANAQESSKAFLVGAPRGGGGGARHESGLTKKQREALGTALTEEMIRTGKPASATRTREIAQGLGIDPALLGI